MPSWGKDGFVEFPNGIRVGFFNHYVLVLRPLGYKASPRHAPTFHGAADDAVINSPPDAPTAPAAPTNTLIHGKALPRAAVTTKLLHRMSGHLPRRDLIHLPDAWCDAPPSWTTDVLKETKEETCEACV